MQVMNSTIKIVIAILVGGFISMAYAQTGQAQTGSVAEILNYREYSPRFASSGQPTEAQLQSVKDAGFERVIYIAFSNNPNALANEDQIVKSLGMDYLHIPVDWNNPTTRDFYAFADAMQRESERKTLLHCQVNARATAFSFLYRVIYEDVPVALAKQDMLSVWEPNETWSNFVSDVLQEHGKPAEW
jgi:protein tyrosine phosphatase (PTP) superfamily phosphohydrolase (DUF442 family)